MDKFELWLCVVGGDSDDERLLYRGNDKMDLEQAVMDADEEVITDSDKYFLLNDIQFYSHRDFCNDVVIRHELMKSSRDIDLAREVAFAESIGDI